MDAGQFPIMNDPAICMKIEAKPDFNHDGHPWSFIPKEMASEFRKRLRDSRSIRYCPEQLAILAAEVSRVHHAKSHMLHVATGMVVVTEIGAELFRLGASQSHQIRLYLSRRLAAPGEVHFQGKPRDDWTGTRWQYFLDEKCEIIQWPDPSTLRQLVRVTEPVDRHTDLTLIIEELRDETRTLRESGLSTATPTEGQTADTVANAPPSYIDYGLESDDEAATSSSAAATNVGARGSSHKRSISDGGRSDDGSRGSNGKRPKQEVQD